MPSTGRDEHDELRRAMTRFAMLMSDPTDANRAQLTRERMMFSRLFARHLADERNALAAYAAATSQAMPLLHEYDRRVGALRTDYSAHIACWAPSSISGRWRDYVTAVLGLQRRLRELMDWEERALPILH